MTTLFISDLHLEASRPDITQCFLSLLDACAKKAEALYILGDLFEAWIGDDDHGKLQNTVISALRKLTDRGTSLYFMAGNRDFLIGKKFASASGCQLLPDPSVIDLYGVPTLLMHGDTLCTADTRYLAARARYRQPFYRYLFLSLPLSWRRKITQGLRHASKQHTRELSQHVMDATFEEIIRVMTQYQTKLLIHGHTHRPTIHYFQHEQERLCRIVLPDWDKCSGALVCEPDHQRRLVKY